jgi:hypothetical protein
MPAPLNIVTAMLRTALLAVLCAFLVPTVAAARAPSPAAPPAPSGPRVVLAFLPGRETGPQTKVMLARFAKRPSLGALGFVSATAGTYDATQALLDIGQGTRTSFNVYRPRKTPNTALVDFRGGGFVQGWFDILRRAQSAPEELHPGLLGSSIPGGTGFVGIRDQPNPPSVAAANEDGVIPGLSLGRPDSVVPRTATMLRQRRFVVVYLPAKRAGGRALDGLLADRTPNELLMVMREPPTKSASVLLPIAAAGLGTGNLTSATSRGDGLVTGIDILPTVLEHLGVPVPTSVKGQPMSTTGARDPDALLAFDKRSRVVTSRRISTLQGMLLAWLGVVLLFGVIFGPKGVRRGMRIGGLAAMWTPSALLIPATFLPGRQLELYIVAGAALALAIVSDLLLPWPKATILPAVFGIGAYTFDLANGSDLIVRSLLGPNPRFGSRFYGLGNELEATLPVIALAGAAAVPALAHRSRRAAAAFGVIGLTIGIIFGSGRLGADVGGVVTVGVGFAVTTALMLPGRATWRRAVAVLLVPVAGLALLAAIDIVTGGNSHFSRSVLGAGSLEELWRTFERRYELAYQQLVRGLMPVLTFLAVLAAVYGIRFRTSLLSQVRDTDSWSAALAGALAGSVAGALSNDSGPLILVYGVITAAFVVIYLRGDPRLTPVAEPAPPEADDRGDPPPETAAPSPEPVEVGTRR